MRWLEIFIAMRYLRSKKQNGFISLISTFSLLGITLGVAALIIVMSVMNGYRKDLIQLTLGFNGHITINSRYGVIPNYENLLPTLKKVPGITHVTPLIERQMMATKGKQATGVIVKGIARADLKEKKLVSNSIYEGSLDTFQGTEGGIVLGEALASTLQARVGDMITLISSEGNATVLGTIPRHKEYPIIGLYRSGMYLYDSTTIFLPLEAAQILFRLKEQVSQLEIITTDPTRTDKVMATLYETLNSPAISIEDWQHNNASILDALQIERSVMFLILTLIIVVAAFNIISSLIMLVQDKKGAIAILRTMGATRKNIISIFFLCGAVVGIGGTIIGALLGITFALNIEAIRQFLERISGSTLFDPVIYYLTRLPADLHSQDIVRIVLLSIGLSCIATLFPAWQASKIHPAEALRYE